MKQTLENWYSQNQLTPQQYYQLVDLVNPNIEYQLPELVLLASLPTTAILPDPANELSKFKLNEIYEIMKTVYRTGWMNLFLIIFLVKNFYSPFFYLPSP